MNRILLTITDRYINMKCKTDDEIKEYIKKQPNEEVIIKTIITSTEFHIRTMHHPELYKFCGGIRLYIDGVTDEWYFPFSETMGQLTRDEAEKLIPAIKEAMQMLGDRVYNTKKYIIEF